MLIHGGGSETGFYMRTYQHSCDLAATIGEVGRNGFVKGDDEHAVPKLRAVDDWINIGLQPCIGRGQFLVIGA